MGAELELPMPGEPDEEPAGGGGRGPCCWAIAGIANARTVPVKKRIKLAARGEIIDEEASFANMVILSGRYHPEFGRKG
jgi:hypothetical protein